MYTYYAIDPNGVVSYPLGRELFQRGSGHLWEHLHLCPVGTIITESDAQTGYSRIWEKVSVQIC